VLIREGLVWRIGNGKTTRIWDDRWLPNPSTYRVQSSPAILDLLATVSHLIDIDGHVWKNQLLDQLFSAKEIRVDKNNPHQSN
jgi:hypothetical protein